MRSVASEAAPRVGAVASAPGRSRRLWRAASTLAVVVALGLAARGLDFAALRTALAAAAAVPLAAGALVTLGVLVARAGYWRVIVSAVADVPIGKMLWYTVSSAGASMVLPMRGGEAVRVYALRERHGVPLPVIGAAFGFEKVADVASLVLLATPLPWLLPGVGPPRRLFVAGGLALLGLALALVLGRRRARSSPWLAKLRIFETPRAPLVGLAWVLAAWVVDAALVLVVMRSVGLPASVGTGVTVLLAANLAIAIPAAPANLGTLELGVAFALTRLGVAQERAAAFALLYHALQLATLGAAWGLGALMRSARSEVDSRIRAASPVREESGAR